MTNALDTLVRYSTLASVHKLRALAPMLDRALMLKLALRESGDNADDDEAAAAAWLDPRRAVRVGDVVDDSETVDASMRTLERYIAHDEYEPDVGHALMHRMLHGDAARSAERDCRAAGYLLAQLVRSGRSALLKRQLLYVRNNYAMVAGDSVPLSDEEALEAAKAHDLHVQELECAYHALVRERTAKRQSLAAVRAQALRLACEARHVVDKESAGDDSGALHRAGWACATQLVAEARSALRAAESAVAASKQAIVAAKEESAPTQGAASRALRAVFERSAFGAPFFDEMARSVPFCGNVAGCLVRMALAHSAYRALALLLECGEFDASVPASATECAGRAAAGAILKIFHKQSGGERATLTHIPAAAEPALERAERGVRNETVRHFHVLALIEQRARMRERLRNEVDERGDVPDAARAKIAHDLLCEKLPTLRKEEIMTALETLLAVDDALADALIALRTQLTSAPGADVDEHAGALARIISKSVPFEDELVGLPERAPHTANALGAGADATSDSDADVDDKLSAPEPRDPLAVSLCEMERLLSAAPEPHDAESDERYVDATIALVHALYRYRALRLQTRVSATREQLAAADAQTTAQRAQKSAKGAAELAQEVAQLTAADYFGFDDE